MKELKVGDKITVIAHRDFSGTETLYTDIPIGTRLVVTRLREMALTETTVGQYIYFDVTLGERKDERYYRSDEVDIAFKPISNIKVFLNKSGKKYE